jgi:hypothetical protein
MISFDQGKQENEAREHKHGDAREPVKSDFVGIVQEEGHGERLEQVESCDHEDDML